MTVILASRRMPKEPRRRLILVMGAVVLALLIGTAVPISAQDDPVIAKVNGVDVRASDLDLADEAVGGNLPPIPPAEKRNYLLAYVADMIIVAKAAEAKKMPDSNDFKRRLAFLRNKLLMEQFLQGETKGAVTDAALRKTYDEFRKRMADEKEIRARHILVETEAEAKAILEQIKKGADFAELAKQKSKDPSKVDGGDVGYFGKDQMVEEFTEAAFKLDKGQVSSPVKTEFGWHIIKIEDKRDREVTQFDEMKDQLEAYVVDEAKEQIVKKLRESARIERIEPRSVPPGKR